ncbi:Skp1 family, tetramerization domain containing protein [Plasmodiophora brassicae]|uniref:Uncharacterized protein n=1 Tax=Plasmodiophora brassicae TaxID=37360 RepID=A0A0G4IXZ3_PLABS|nr:hypothetical protein PBRA_007909 [Plasmodiophora brassicae]SPQ98982.1 unnamed protein product [Plasmodiophora brassicae]
MGEQQGPSATDDIKGLDEDMHDEVLTLESQDKMRIQVERNVAMMSELVKTVLESDKDQTVIPLPNVKGAILDKVVKYLRYHVGNPSKEIEKPLKSAIMREVVDDPWDAEYVDIPQDVLFELILAANYMDIKPLLDLTCAKVASMLKGKSPEEIRKQFNIVNDFTPEEEEAVRNENKWAEES